MTEHIITGADGLDEGDRILTEIDGRELAIYKIDNSYYAYINWCPHQSGPVCEGALTGTCEAEYDEVNMEWKSTWSDDQRVINCPWHGWEFDVKTGEGLMNEDLELASYPVRQENGKIIVEV